MNRNRRRGKVERSVNELSVFAHGDRGYLYDRIKWTDVFYQRYRKSKKSIAIALMLWNTFFDPSDWNMLRKNIGTCIDRDRFSYLKSVYQVFRYGVSGAIARCQLGDTTWLYRYAIRQFMDDKHDDMIRHNCDVWTYKQADCCGGIWGVPNREEETRLV